MAIQIHIRGIEELNRFLRVFPNNVAREVNLDSEGFLKRVRKSAKLRAPRWTGSLANSIVVRKSGKNTFSLLVDSPYGIFQETGFKPHWVQLNRSARISGLDVADWAASKGIPDTQGSIFVSHFKPFVGPALSIELQKLPQYLESSINRAVRRSK